MSEIQLEHKRDRSSNLSTHALTHSRTAFKGIPMNILFIFAKRFIAGQTLEEALPVVENSQRGFWHRSIYWASGNQVRGPRRFRRLLQGAKGA